MTHCVIHQTEKTTTFVKRLQHLFWVSYPLSVSHISNDCHMKKEHINLYSLRQAFLYLTVTNVRGSGDFLHGTALP